MTIYIIIIFVLLLSLCFPKKYDNKIVFPLSVFLCLVAVFRGKSVGTDILIYNNNFFHTTLDVSTWSKFGDTFEPGFSFLMGLYRELISKTDYLTFYGLIFLVFFLGFLYYVRINDYPIKLSVLFFVLLGFYPMSFNYMRQFFAIGLFLFASAKLIKDKRYLWLFLIILCIGFFFHRSSLILLGFIPLLFLSEKGVAINKKWYILLVVASFLIILVKQQFIDMVMNANFVLNLFSSNEDRYLNYIEMNSDMGYLTSLMQSLFCIFVICITPKNMLSRFEFLGYLFGVIIYNIVSIISGVAVRFPIAYLLFSTMFFSLLWYRLQSKKAIIFKSTVIIYSLVYFIYNFLVLNKGEIVPYVSRFD